MEYLVERGVDFNKANAEGYTPLLIAAANGEGRVVEYLVGKGADKNEADYVEQPMLREPMRRLQQEQSAAAAGYHDPEGEAAWYTGQPRARSPFSTPTQGPYADGPNGVPALGEPTGSPRLRGGRTQSYAQLCKVVAAGGVAVVHAARHHHVYAQ